MVVEIIKTMSEKTFLGITSLLFAFIFVVHLLRVINGWEFHIGGWDAPMWVSWVTFLLGGYLSWTAFKLKKK